MTKLWLLYAGELARLWKYGIAAASLVVALIWVGVLHYVAPAAVRAILPLVLFVDATLMAILYAGVTLVYESQEHTLKSMLVMPISRWEYLFSKSLATVTTSLTTLALVLTYVSLVKGLNVGILGLLGAVALLSFTFAQLGIVMTYRARDFTDLLMSMFVFSFAFAIPTMLEFAGILQGRWVELVQYLNPTKNALVLLQAPVAPVPGRDLAIALAYILALGASLHLLTLRWFDRYAMRGDA